MEEGHIMKIKYVNLVDFGKFKDKAIDFKDGINLIYGENESGKSTIHSFIKASLYGFNKSKNRRFVKNEEYDIYFPINSINYKGDMTLIDKDDEYIIRNDFKNKEYTLIKNKVNIDLYNEKEDRKYTPGEYLLGVGREVFENTVFMNIDNLRFANKNRSVKDELHKLKDGDKSIQGAIEIIDNEIKNIGSDRASQKPYMTLQKEIKDLDREIYRLQSEAKNIEELLDKKNLYEKKIKNLKNKIENLGDDKLKDLKLKYISLMQERDRTLSNIKEDSKYNIKILEKDINTVRYLDNLLKAGKIKGKKGLSDYVGSDKKIIWTFFELVLALLLLAYYFISKKSAAFYVAVAYIALITLFNVFLFVFSKKSDVSGIDMHYEEKMKVLQKYGFEESSELEELFLKQSRIEDKEDKLRFIENELEELKPYEEKFSSMDVEDASVRKHINYDDDMAAFREELSDTQIIYERINNIIEENDKKIKDLELIYDKRNELYKKINTMHRRRENLRIAKELLILSQNKMDISIIPQIMRKSSEYMNIFSNYQVESNEDGSLFLEDTKKRLNLDEKRLSRGTFDQLYISYRLALSDEIYTKDIFFILDDALSSFDDVRLKKILKLLCEISERRQVIIFTCQKREKSILDDLKLCYNYHEI